MAQPYVIRSVMPDGSGGQYLTVFDPDHIDPDYPGRIGYAEWTRDPGKALKFLSRGEAFLFWQTKSVVAPVRPDGRPNRPLTAISVSIEPLPEEE